MGQDAAVAGVPINEVVYFLNQTHKGLLSDIREESPELLEELDIGIIAGEGDPEKSQDDTFVRKKGRIVVEALHHLSQDADKSASFSAKRIRLIRRVKLVSEILVLLGSSAVLGTLGLEDNLPKIIAAVATFVAGCGTIFVEQSARILNPELGDIFSAYLADKKYQGFSIFPYIVRDIAMWVPSGATADEVRSTLADNAGDLCQRVDQFDQFEKDGRISYGFRLVFQSPSKTLSDDEVNTEMEPVNTAVADKGWEVR